MDCNTIYVSEAQTTDTGVILIPNRAVKKLTNTNCYKIIIACNVEATANLPVFIQTNLGNIPCFCKFLNTLYSSQLNKRTMYVIGYGNGNEDYAEGQIVFLSNVCPRNETATSSPTSL